MSKPPVTRAGRLQGAIDHLVGVVMELREADQGEDTGLTLGALMEREREAWGLSLQDLANATGLSKAHLWELEQHRTADPRISTIVALATALKLPPIQVLNAALTTRRLESGT